MAIQPTLGTPLATQASGSSVGPSLSSILGNPFSNMDVITQTTPVTNDSPGTTQNITTGNVAGTIPAGPHMNSYLWIAAGVAALALVYFMTKEKT